VANKGVILESAAQEWPQERTKQKGAFRGSKVPRLARLKRNGEPNWMPWGWGRRFAGQTDSRSAEVKSQPSEAPDNGESTEKGNLSENG